MEDDGGPPRRAQGRMGHAGLPVEIEVQKRLGLTSNAEIEAMGIGAFNEACRESVWIYEEAWKEMTQRMGFWVDLEDPYVTLHNPYIESTWWALKRMFDQDLLYRGHKVLPFCPQTGTSYSSHEVALGYKEVTEPSVYAKFHLIDDDASILAWTTTPWTLPGNVGLAVGPEVPYVRVRVTEAPKAWSGPGGAQVGEELILAEALMKQVLRHTVEVIERFLDPDLIEPMPRSFPDAIDGSGSETAWTILGADWVTTTDGTGVVHTAVMYGEDDYHLGMEAGLPAQHGRHGWNLPPQVHPDLGDREVKACDERIIEILDGVQGIYTRKPTPTITPIAGVQVTHCSTMPWIPGSFE